MAIDAASISLKFKTQKRHKGGKKSSFGKLAENGGSSYHLILFCISKKLPKHQLMLAKNNFVVNLISVLEVYLKELIMENDIWKESGYSKLFKEKITLSDAYHIFGTEKITRQYLIAQTLSLKNFEAIDSVFSNLLDVPFYNMIENQKRDFTADNSSHTSLKTEYPNWRLDLMKIFEYRNNYVHYGAIMDFTNTDVDNMFSLIVDFTISIDEFIDHIFSQINDSH